jgi:hypothetical protein
MPENKVASNNETKTQQGLSRIEALTAAASSPGGTVSEVMDQLPPDRTAPSPGKDEKSILQGIAHGAEGYGNEYGSGPGVANADAGSPAVPAVPGDSASPAASALSTRHKDTLPAHGSRNPGRNNT